ncbi:Dynein light chain roadblock-type 2 [Eumeta japonica]|uniref:Dynein light chain roadblock n=1 Tax=Eumeta variegata TaxID=151549 RepID=A0A4C1UNF5_EUMVA|nr:Dynein light chain roadblock-type 2 [Eumeta japonica]
MANEAEETVKKLAALRGVVGLVIVNGEGIPVKSTLDNHISVQYAGLMSALVQKAKSVVRDLDPTNALTFLRIRSKKSEIIVAPDQDFIMIVVQDPAE